MNYDSRQVAERLRGLREILGLSLADLAKATSVIEEEYAAYESGERDFALSFLYKCAEAMHVDIIELLTGEVPKLKTYTLVRAGKGLPIERRERFAYQHLAYLFKDKGIEPLLVTAPYSSEEQNQPVKVSTHAGQEFDYVLKGTMKFVIAGHEEILHAGDALYYNSENPHGMIAVNGEPCEFLAILIKK